MRFLADENFPRAAVIALEAAGHDIAWISLVQPGATDIVVLEIVQRTNRTLLTFDKDFGESAARSPLPFSSGVVLFRIAAPRSEAAAQLLVARIGARSDWNGHFSVVEPGRVRMRQMR